MVQHDPDYTVVQTFWDSPTCAYWHATKWGAGRICGDKLRITRAYLRISDHYRVTVRVSIRVRDRVRFADCYIQTAGESDKMRISHVINKLAIGVPPRRSAPLRILSCPFLLLFDLERPIRRVNRIRRWHVLGSKSSKRWAPGTPFFSIFSSKIPTTTKGSVKAGTVHKHYCWRKQIESRRWCQ